MKKNKSNKFYLLKSAFTLAEILITIGIIGVIAAITIPIIKATFEDMQYTSALKANYKLISDATSQIKESYGETLNGVFTSNTKARTEYLNYLKYTKTCDGAGILGDCWYDGYAKTFDTGEFYTGGSVGAGTTITWWGLTGATSAILSNGTALYFQVSSSSCSTTSACLRIFIDTNGLKEPNTLGKDIYYFFVYADRVSANGWDVASLYGGGGSGMGKWRLLH